VDLVVTRLDGEVQMRHESVPFLGLEAGRLESMCRQAGGRSVTVFGDYRQRAYDRSESTDLLIVVEK
jgi:poly(A) polymerase Pap1